MESIMNHKSNIRLLSRISRTAGLATGLAVGLAAFSTGATAADADIGSRIATGVGQAIAAQGNAALMHIREELGETLQQTVDTFLPATTPQAQATTPAPDTAAL
jgi:hypothetical protein